MAEYRVDELARAAGTSVRNVRAYQDRGLLARPRRVGRTGIYSETHLNRLRLIRSLLQRGYTFATISELLSAHSQGLDVEDLMRMRDLATLSWAQEEPGRMSTEDLIRVFGEFTQMDLDRATSMGLVVPDDDGFRVPSPRLLEAGAKLMSLGMPLSTVLDLAEGLSTQMQHVAELIFRTLSQHLADGHATGEDLLGQILSLRPFARQSVDALLGIAMARESARAVGAR